MKFLRNIGISFFLLAVLLIVINAVTRNAVKEPAQARVQETSKPIMTRAVETIRPAAEAYSDAMHQKMLEGMAGGSGQLSEAAKTILAQKNMRDLEKNRGPRRSMQECIKPNSLIDEDVQMCMKGLIQKSW